LRWRSERVAIEPTHFLMSPSLTLEGRLKVSIGLILLIILVLGFLWAVRDAKEDVRQEAMASVGLALGLIDATIQPDSLESSSISGWISKIGALDRIRHLRISATPLHSPPFSRPSQPPSGRISAVPGWFSKAVMSAPIVATREITVSPDLTMRIRIESDAEDEIREAWTQTRDFMMLLAIFAVAVYLSVHLIVGRALRPVSRILGGLQQIQAGDYDTQLKIPGLPELDRIIEGINHVSKTLKETRDENRALTRHSLLIQEEERRILAKEMHDEVGQNLTAIKMMSALVPEVGPNREHAALEIQRLCDRLFSVVRSIIHRLRPMILEDLGLKAALDDLAEHWRSMAPDLQISIRCDASIEHLSGETALEIYRIVQEAMTNIVRHSGATKSEVSIFPRDPHELLLIVRDNGRGLSSAVIRRGFGLLGMRERVASLDGRFQLMSEPGQGLEIQISLPIEDIQNG